MRYTCKLSILFLIYFAIVLIASLWHSKNVFAKPDFPFDWNDNYLCRMIDGGFKLPKVVAGGRNAFWHDLKRLFAGPKPAEAYLPAAASVKAYPIRNEDTICGNGVLEGEEECDGSFGLDAKQICSKECKRIRLDYCGDGIVSVDEFCDDGNNFNGDGCSSYCTFDDMADEMLYDLGSLPSEQLLIYWPTLPTITNEVRVENVEEFNSAASHPWTRILVTGDLHGDSVISASDIEVIVSAGVKIDFLYIGSGVDHVRISGGEYNEITIKSPVTFWPKYQVYYDDVVEDIVIENVTVRSAAYYAFFGMARRFALLNSKFYSESSTFTSENPDGMKGEHYIIAGNEFYSKGPLPNIYINGTNRLFFVDNLLINGNAFNSVNLQIDKESSFAYVARNTFVGTGISLSSDGSWVEDNTFYHDRGTLFDAQSQVEGLTLINNTTFSNTKECLICGADVDSWIVFKNNFFDYETPPIEDSAYFETESDAGAEVVRLKEPVVSEASPGQERNELRPFFIGQSLLNVWIPKMVDDIADSLGKNNIYAYDETYLTGTGASLRWNFNHPYDGQGADPFVELIQPRKYGALILSDAVPAINFEEETKEFAYRFYQMGLQGNSELELFLFATWVHKDNLSFSDWSAAVDDESAVWERVRNYLVYLSGRDNIYIIPGGIALKMLVAEADAGRVPGLANGDALFEEDMIHLNALGNYFMSLVHYACLYRSNPLNAAHITFSPWGGENRPLPDLELAERMQQIAWEVVSTYPNSGVGKDTREIQCGNGILENAEECDDGNRFNGDGCSARCQMEPQLKSKGEPESGNGAVKPDESRGDDDDDVNSNDEGTPSYIGKMESEPEIPTDEVSMSPLLLQPSGDEAEEESGRVVFPISDDELKPSVKVGVNLNWNYDYIQQWMFVDAMKHAQPWRTKSAGEWQGWDTEVADEIEWRSDGYPAEIPAKTSKGSQIVCTRMLSNHQLGEGGWPAGQYQVFYDGDGDLKFKGDATVVDQMAGQYTIRVQPKSNLELQIVRSNRNNPVRNIRVIMPGFEKMYASHPFHPLFLERLGRVAALKFTYPAVTNFHPNGNWRRRVTPQYFSQGTDKGIALEYMVQLANITSKNAWFNVPHAADDQYVRHYAEYLRDNLDTGLTIYFEYSNEIWNESYEQSWWLSGKGCEDEATFVPHTEGQDRGIQGCDDVAARVRAAAKRMVEVFEIVDDVFIDQPYRLVKVISGKTDEYEYNDRLWDHFTDPDINPNGVIANAFAIAPFFGRSQSFEAVLNSDRGGGLLSVNDILDIAANDLETTVGEWLSHYSHWTRSRNLLLLAYEAGNYLTCTVNGHELAEKVERASRHPRMGTLYSKYFDRWKHFGGDLMMMSAYIDLPGVGTTRGILEYQDQPLGEAYIYQAVMGQTDHSQTAVVCGDGIAQAWELCDDGNRRDGDGCSRYCIME